jgi:uncharacterized metal-binding protein
MSDSDRRVVIVPCSGIGKTFGSVSREAAYEVVEDIRPGATELVALSLLVLGDPEARAALSARPVVTIDGCKLACAARMVKECGGTVTRGFEVLELYRGNRHLKPLGIAELNDDGHRLAHVLAGEIAETVDHVRDGQGGDDA